ncbi:GNAT family N-acetyltransferase [Streptomyces sp. CB01373]|uniref:GNAT family N-acetyltransferase n=1 Tax=Streptomyces sp. CB01373 TaxID=2020325 RepID=UPI000C2715EE|nr:GNAT family N-acetyltransferase [Streptomyces sp. CB01373]PJM94430.1 GNAT family N-acetyltransferase [Streptomyces sp. CB01373]
MNRALPVVRLRVPTDEDAVAWHQIFADPDVMEFHGGRPAELSVYEELTARQRRHDAERGFCLWTMLDETGRVIGFTGAQPWERDWGPTGEIEIGWRLSREHWGRGYVTAAAQMTLERLRGAGLTSVVAMVDSRNKRSIAVTERLGMSLAQTFVTPVSERQGQCYRLEL